MPARSGPISNVVAGAFLLVGVVLAIAVSFVLSRVGERVKDRTSYTVQFKVADGAAGIKKGSDVLLGGQAVGKVTKIGFVPETGVVTDINVKVRIDADLVLYRDAMIFLERPLLGSLSTINITSLGNAEPGKSVVLGEGDTITARLAPPSFLAQAGFGAPEADRVQKIIARAEMAVNRAADLVDRNGPKIDQTFDDASGLVRDVRTRVPEWTGAIDRSVANVESASAKAGPLLENAGAGLKEMREMLAEARAAVDEGRPRLTQILAETEEAVGKINRESIDRLNVAIDDAQKALKTFTEFTSGIGALIREESPNIRKALANARLASDQLKLAAVEIRSQPWRLLYTPSLKETETSVLYDSARAYATAVSDLRATSESLAAALEAAESPAVAGAVDRAGLEDLAAHLRGAFEKYKTAERDLLDRLIREGGTSALPPPNSSRGTPRAGDGR